MHCARRDRAGGLGSLWQRSSRGGRSGQASPERGRGAEGSGPRRLSGGRVGTRESASIDRLSDPFSRFSWLSLETREACQPCRTQPALAGTPGPPGPGRGLRGPCPVGAELQGRAVPAAPHRRGGGRGRAPLVPRVLPPGPFRWTVGSTTGAPRARARQQVPGRPGASSGVTSFFHRVPERAVRAFLVSVGPKRFHGLPLTSMSQLSVACPLIWIYLMFPQ